MQELLKVLGDQEHGFEVHTPTNGVEFHFLELFLQKVGEILWGVFGKWMVIERLVLLSHLFFFQNEHQWFEWVGNFGEIFHNWKAILGA